MVGVLWLRFWAISGIWVWEVGFGVLGGIVLLGTLALCRFGVMRFWVWFAQVVVLVCDFGFWGWLSGLVLGFGFSGFVFWLRCCGCAVCFGGCDCGVYSAFRDCGVVL